MAQVVKEMDSLLLAPPSKYICVDTARTIKTLFVETISWSFVV